MAVDEAILKLHSQDLAPPTLRFYSWQPAALSLGYFQQAAEAVDLKKCQALNLDLTRRLTGGRAILHDQELTYSIILREDYGLLADSIEKSYQQISRGLVAGLNSLNIKAELKAVDRGKKAPRGHSAACFDAPSWHEIILNQKKLIGSAQRRRDNTILQHGSLPQTEARRDIFNILKYNSDQERKKARRLFKLKSTNLNEAGYSFSKKELASALTQGLADKFKIEFELSDLTAAEKSLAEKLAAEKYRSKEWNLKR